MRTEELPADRHSSSGSVVCATASPTQTPASTSLTSSPSICDLQEKFRERIHEFPRVITTTQKMLRASQILNIPVFATTQRRDKLGHTCEELGLDAPGGVVPRVHCDKSRFSMWEPAVQRAMAALDPNEPQPPPRQIAIVGIESHVCVTQTTLDLLHAGHAVYVIADGVSSCNAREVPVALERLRVAGAVVTTSEAWLFECMGDAGIAEFREMSALVKEYSKQTGESLQALCRF